MRIGVDIDNVLYDWDAAARQVLRAGYEPPDPLTESQKDQLANKSTGWDTIEQIVGPKNWVWFWESANETEMFLQPGRDYSSSLLATAELSLNHDVFLVTSRPRRFAWQTFEWLGGLLPPIEARGVIHWGNKVKVAKSLSLQVVVDDKAETLKSYALRARNDLKGLYIYGVTQPWNRGLSTSYYRFKWVNDLSELLSEPWNVKETA